MCFQSCCNSNAVGGPLSNISHTLNIFNTHTTRSSYTPIQNRDKISCKNVPAAWRFCTYLKINNLYPINNHIPRNKKNYQKLNFEKAETKTEFCFKKKGLTYHFLSTFEAFILLKRKYDAQICIMWVSGFRKWCERPKNPAFDFSTSFMNIHHDKFIKTQPQGNVLLSWNVLYNRLQSKTIRHNTMQCSTIHDYATYNAAKRDAATPSHYFQSILLHRIPICSIAGCLKSIQTMKLRLLD